MMGQFFNFRHMPFERDIPTGALYATPQSEELLSRLEYAALNRKFCVVTGGVGVGKTTAVRKFAESLDKNIFRLVYIADSALTPRVFYREALSQMSSDEKPNFYRSEGKRIMMECFARMAEGAVSIPVIVIDEAHLLSHAMLEETRFLLNNCMDSQNAVSLVLVGQNELRAKLSKEVFEPITQRIDFRFALPPYDRAQTQDYIDSHMLYAGADSSDVFAQSAIDAVFGYSGGVARKINKACSMALLYAAQKGKRSIDGGTVDYVVEQELSW
jgi:type II secretory pathway predicted ATPase ExeA